jgi:Zn-dependent protease with chaperone function
MSFLKIPLTLLLYRKHEYDADNYAIKAGYGKEIASSLSKLEKAYIKATQGHKCGVICKVIRRIEEAMDEHPPIRKRIEQALKNVELMKAIAKAKISSITIIVKNFFGKGK